MTKTKDSEVTQVQKAKNEWLASQIQIEDLYGKKAAFETKKAETEKELEDLAVILEDYRKQKSEALALHAIGEIDDTQCYRIQKRQEDAEKRTSFLKELVSSIEDQIISLDAEGSELRRKDSEFQRAMWIAIYEELMPAARKSAPDVLKLYIAYRNSGGFLDLGHFLEDRVFGLPRGEQYEKLHSELAAQYEGN